MLPMAVSLLALAGVLTDNPQRRLHFLSFRFSMPTPSNSNASLRESLDYEPRLLKFGTSGRRGEVVHLTQLEVYINALAELQYLQSRCPAEGGIRRGDEFFFAYDLRPSSSGFVGQGQDRGGLAQAVERAINDAGMQPVNLGTIPTPALASYALERGQGSIMVTGSHIPFDRNGYKTYSATGELLKTDEAPINTHSEQVRARLYDQPYEESPFDRRGLFKLGHETLSPERDVAAIAYVRRYVDFFSDRSLRGLRILVYQHSAVGRDLLVEILQRLGAEAVPAGRVETFAPIDTENIDEEFLGAIQTLVDRVSAQHGSIDAIVSTDGDSDRPLVLGIDEAGRVRFFGGDLLGMLVAEYIRAGAVVVPISCNDAVDRGPLADLVEPKTRIGSPYIVAAMQRALEKGRQAVCGWEANGGFFTASDIESGGRVLKTLPTRDAMLPILGVLFSMREKQVSLTELFDLLPKRFSRSALLRDFPIDKGRQIVRRFSPTSNALRRIVFQADGIAFLDDEGAELPASAPQTQMARSLRESLTMFFPADLGFGSVVQLDYTDGVRISFSNGDVAHIRPSGNADELRIYAVANTQERADQIAGLGVAAPDGILRRMEKALSHSSEGQDRGTGDPGRGAPDRATVPGQPKDTGMKDDKLITYIFLDGDEFLWTGTQDLYPLIYGKLFAMMSLGLDLAQVEEECPDTHHQIRQGVDFYRAREGMTEIDSYFLMRLKLGKDSADATTYSLNEFI